MAGLFTREPIPLIYIDDVSLEPYSGIHKEGTCEDRSLKLLTYSLLISFPEKTEELMGCCLNFCLSFGCDTITTSSRSLTFEVSIATASVVLVSYFSIADTRHVNNVINRIIVTNNFLILSQC